MILTASPDLSVKNIFIEKDSVVSEERFKVSFTVTNIGSGNMDKNWWYDRIVSSKWLLE